MAATRSYDVQTSLIKVAPHHGSIKALWDSKWRPMCARGLYPFMDGKVEDFDPVFEKLVQMNLVEPWETDVYAEAFFPPARHLIAQAEEAENSQDAAYASELYLRAAAMYRIARFPICHTPKTFEAWELGKEAYLKGAKYLDPPVNEVVIPHKYAKPGDGQTIKIYTRFPKAANRPLPVVIFICGLDAYRTDHTPRTSEHCRRGFACISVEIPGTGDAPGAPNDPESCDRQWDTLIDWIQQQQDFDKTKICVRAVSTGGYYAMRIAHTHADHLCAVVSQGGGSHRMFDKEWIAAQDRMEYPFELAEALAFKFGYKSVAEYSADAQPRFSLLETGIFDKPSCRLLLINGTHDEIFPIEDSQIPLEHGRIKDARFIHGAYHMGNPAAEPMVYDWLDQFK